VAGDGDPKGGGDPGAGGDPHIIGFVGEKYDFMGKHGRCYAMFSSGTLQINARMAEVSPDYTYMDRIGAKIGNPAAKLACPRVSVRTFGQDGEALFGEAGLVVDVAGHG
jgi:hypothetical protein